MLTPGTRIGAYEITSFIAAGGMGEVYRARDTRLLRDVAVKILSPALTNDPERVARFEQEARAAAALNHPHIVAVHDLGQWDGVPYIVSEVLEGATLRDVAASGPLPVRRVVDYAIQIAHGLAAAHETGIVHRDLKPENIFVTNDGRVKILDFGLAKLTERAPTGSIGTLAPTVPHDTAPGMVLGTIGYMAPEQVRGTDTDARADVFAFGAILYELLSGRRAFHGDTPADVMSAILKEHPPELPLLQRQIPPAFQRIVERCLEKHPSARFQSMRDLAFAIETLPSASEVGVDNAPHVAYRRPRIPRSAVAAAIATAAFIATLPLALAHWREKPAELPRVRFTVPVPRGTQWPNGTPVLALSPDGRYLVLRAFSRDPFDPPKLWLHPLDGSATTPIAGSDDATDPFWSPDSRNLAFFASGKLKRFEVGGGGVQTLADAPGAYGGTWSGNGTILFGSANGSILELPPEGGQPILRAAPAVTGQQLRFPTFLPDGRRFLYFANPAGEIRLASLENNATRTLFKADSRVVYAANGYLLFARDAGLWAQPFDAARGTITGEAVRVADDIAIGGQRSGRAAFAASANGLLAFREAFGSTTQLTWLDRTGAELGRVGNPDAYEFVNLSPDARQASVTMFDRTTNAQDIWIYDLARSGARTRFTFDPTGEMHGIWSPDGTRIVYSAGPNRRMLLESTAGGAGSGEPLVSGGDFSKYADSWSADGRYFLYASGPDTSTGNDVWALPLFGDRKPFPFLNSPFNEFLAVFSPTDAHWVAYQSNESGRYEIYLTAFPDRRVKVPASTTGGTFPRWRRDGEELFYLSGDGKMMSVAIRKRGSDYDVGVARPLFAVDARGSWPYDVTPDGQRFLVNTAPSRGDEIPVVVVGNWTGLLAR